MILNITYNGLSADYDLRSSGHLSDADVRRIAAEVIRSGDLRGMHIVNLPRNAFRNYVVDRVRDHRGKERIYLRPKVPFGAELGA